MNMVTSMLTMDVFVGDRDILCWRQVLDVDKRFVTVKNSKLRKICYIKIVSSNGQSLKTLTVNVLNSRDFSLIFPLNPLNESLQLSFSLYFQFELSFKL